MKFLCIGYYSDAMGALPRDELEAVMRACEPHVETLYASGQLIFDAGLIPDGISLQRVGGTVRAEKMILERERIGSVFLIEAKDMEDAIRVASLHPTTQVLDGERFGWRLVIRPVHHFKAG